jgi:hypothetical protein
MSTTVTLWGPGVRQKGPWSSRSHPCVTRLMADWRCFDVVSWHSDDMAGKEIDPIRAKSALAVIKQNPGIVLFALSPALIALGVIWWLAGVGWAIAAAVVLVLLGGAAVILKR